MVYNTIIKGGDLSKLIVSYKHVVKIKKNKIGILEAKIWQVKKDKCHAEGYKYSLVFIVETKKGKFDDEYLRYDNHRCEGHHKHVRGERMKYEFCGIDKLINDFQSELKKLLKEDNFNTDFLN